MVCSIRLVLYYINIVTDSYSIIIAYGDPAFSYFSLPEINIVTPDDNPISNLKAVKESSSAAMQELRALLGNPISHTNNSKTTNHSITSRSPAMCKLHNLINSL